MKFTDRYPLKPFQVRDAGRLGRVMAAYPLATVITQGEPFPLVSQIPLLYDPAKNVLHGHLDRNNPHSAEIERGGRIYCVFNGPNHYISPSIYPDTQYPGWNYIAVHVEGSVHPIADAEWLEALLLNTADAHEPADSGYQLRPTQKNFHSLLRYILGFEIRISDLRGVFKLAQDKGMSHAELAKNHLSELMREDTSAFLTEMLQGKDCSEDV